MLSTNSDSFISSFPVCMLAFMFLAAALARNSSLMLTRSDGCTGRGRLCLIRSPRGKALRLSPLSVVPGVGFSQVPFIRLRRSPFTSRLLRVPTLILSWP